MFGTMRLFMIATALMLGACVFESQHELWPLGSGEAIPFGDGEYVCLFFNPNENGRPEEFDRFDLAKRVSGNDVWYSAVSDSGEVFPVTFHRVDQTSLYVVARGKTNDNPGQFVFLAWIDETGAAFLTPEKSQVESIASLYSVETGLNSSALEASLEGSPSDQKAFLLELALGLEGADVTGYCMPAADSHE